MSVKIMAALYEKRLGSPQMKAVALKLADCANDEGRSIYPSKCTIAQQTELDRATVFRCVAKLLDMGLLVIDRKSKGGTKKDTTVYSFDLAVLATLPGASEEPVADSHPSQPATPASRRTERSTRRTVRLDPSQPATQTINEPSITVSKSRERAKPPAADTDRTDDLAFDKRKARVYPRPLPEGWTLPDDWREAALEAFPGLADRLDTEAANFRRFNSERMTVATPDEWEAHWRTWCARGAARLPGAVRAAKLREFDAGPSVHDTSEPFAKYMARMIAEGKYKPKGVAA